LWQLLPMEVFEICARPLQAVQERWLDVSVGRFFLCGTDAAIVERHPVETCREFPHGGIAAFTDAFHNGVDLWQDPLDIRSRALHQAVISRGIEFCQTLDLHRCVAPVRLH
jgi:hypothetical protein